MDRYILLVGDMNRSNDIFQAIRMGQKSIETRVAKPTYRLICEGDVLLFRSLATGEEVAKTVVGIRHYESIVALYCSEDMSKIMPGLTPMTLKGVKEIYYSFGGYNEAIVRHGLLAFDLVPVEEV